MKVFYRKESYLKSQRAHLFPLLKPFVKQGEFTDLKRQEVYAISETDVQIVSKMEQADVVVLTMSWNFYVKNNQIVVAKDFIEHALTKSKQVWVVMLGDKGIPFPNYSNVKLFRASGYKSKSPSWHVGLPVFITDPLPLFFNRSKNQGRTYNHVPTVGFCGLAEKSIAKSILTKFKIGIKNMGYYLKIREQLPERVIAPSFFRYKCIKPLIQDKRINHNIILRSKYRAGSKTKEEIQKSSLEFYENIRCSDYVLCVRGAGNFSARFYETLAMGRIPVYVNTDGFLPLSNSINWKNHVVWIEENDIPNIASRVWEFHQRLNTQKLNDMFDKNRKLWCDKLSLGGFFKEHLKDI